MKFLLESLATHWSCHSFHWHFLIFLYFLLRRCPLVTFCEMHFQFWNLHCFLYQFFPITRYHNWGTHCPIQDISCQYTIHFIQFIQINTLIEFLVSQWHNFMFPTIVCFNRSLCYFLFIIMFLLSIWSEIDVFVLIFERKLHLVNYLWSPKYHIVGYFHPLQQLFRLTSRYRRLWKCWIV